MQTLLIPIEGVEAAVEAAPKPNDSVDAVVAAEPNVGAGVTAPKRPPDDAAGAPNICNHAVLPHKKKPVASFTLTSGPERLEAKSL